MTPAASKNKVYSMWDFVGRTYVSVPRSTWEGAGERGEMGWLTCAVGVFEGSAADDGAEGVECAAEGVVGGCYVEVEGLLNSLYICPMARLGVDC